jgi:large subunit ribosomal protein L23Ae
MPKQKGAAKGQPKVEQALKAQKAVKKGVQTKRKRKIRTSVHFRRPHTLRLARNPKYPRKSVPRKQMLDHYRILKYPLTTETAMKKMEEANTLVFLVDVRANKKQIKEAVKRMYDVSVQHVNTLIRPDGQKKAYVRLPPDQDALELASKIGIL